MKKIIWTLAVLIGFVRGTIAAPLYEADVRVDVTAETVTDAKAQAMAQATREALNEVVQSVSTEKSLLQLAELNDNQLQHFISGVMVLMEKSSDVRYIAELRISINEEVLKAYMAENDMPFIVGEEQEVLVIPLLEKEDGTLDLWSDENFWRNAFLTRGRIERGNLDVRLIDKNLGNITAVETNRLYNMSDGEYSELAEFNKINSIYVLKYVPKNEVVFIKSFPERNVDEVKVTAETPQKIIDMVLPFLKGRSKIEMPEQEMSEIVKTYDVVYAYPQLAKWTALKKTLEANPQINEVSIVSMGNGKVRFRFEFSGVIEKLQANLGTDGYQMKNEGGYYVIY
ncbi:MAG: DUF2066 domain-containing protein [Acetobacter sp.]|nr:DUF2066 domain-containing protein [Acetobacter sp.]